ncbi:unnamed protein product [Chilo suppressalis]|uniref:Ig-like domain-containing protein n=1 Tax=Chilo suppressalis TaxID=168631 RepID=A0ABN8B5U8_CHISP|nr:unnamed protein product [Chilo suppressalis]
MTGKTYTPIPRRLRAPPGYQFDGVWTVKDPYSKKNRRRCFGYKGLFGGGCDGGAGGGGYGGSGGFGVGGGGGFSISGGLSISSGVSVTHGIGFRGGIEKLTGGRDGGAKTGSAVDNSRFKLSPDKYSFELSADGVFLFIALKLEWDSSCLGPYYAVFTKEANGRKMEKSLDIVHLEKATVQIPEIKELDLTAGQRAAPQTVQFKCSRCELTRIMVRSDDYNIYNLDTSRYKVTTEDGLNTIEIDLDTVKPKDVGYYTAVFRNEDNNEENVQIIKVDCLRIKRLVLSAKTGEHVDKTLKYECTDCEVTDVVCNGESVTAAGRVSIVNSSKIISFSFPSFEDSNSCVYCGLFKKDNKIYRIVLAVIDTVTVTGAFPITSPPLGEQFEAEVPIQCDECTLEKVLVNGVMLDTAPTRRNSADTPAYYIATPTSITIRINEFSATYEGVYQAVFDIKGEQVTKTILEIRNPHDKSAAPDHGTPGDQITTVATPGEITTVLPGSSTAIETSTEAAEGSESTTASEQGSASTTAPEQGSASTTAPEQGSASSTEAEQDSTSYWEVVPSRKLPELRIIEYSPSLRTSDKPIKSQRPFKIFLCSVGASQIMGGKIYLGSAVKYVTKRRQKLARGGKISVSGPGGTTEVLEALKFLESVINKNVVDEITVNPMRKPDILNVIHNLHPDLLSRPADNVNANDHTLPLLESREIIENLDNDIGEEEENRRFLTWLRNLFNGNSESNNKHKKKDIIKSKHKKYNGRTSKKKSKGDKLETRRLINWFQHLVSATKTSTTTLNPTATANSNVDATRDAKENENCLENNLTRILDKLNNVLEKFNENLDRHNERVNKSMGFVVLKLPLKGNPDVEPTRGYSRRKREVKDSPKAVNKTEKSTAIPNLRSLNTSPIIRVNEIDSGIGEAPDNANKRAVDSAHELKDNLIRFVAETFKEIKLKIAPLKPVKDTYSADDSYIIGYIVACIDTLEVTLTKLMAEMESKKHKVNENQLMELFKRLNTSRTVIGKLMDSLQKCGNQDKTRDNPGFWSQERGQTNKKKLKMSQINFFYVDVGKTARSPPHNKWSLLSMDTCSNKGHSCVAGSERKGSSASLRLPSYIIAIKKNTEASSFQILLVRKRKEHMVLERQANLATGIRLNNSDTLRCIDFTTRSCILVRVVPSAHAKGLQRVIKLSAFVSGQEEGAGIGVLQPREPVLCKVTPDI